MRTSLVLLLMTATCGAQESNATGDQKPVFTDLVEADAAKIAIEVRFVTASPIVFEQLKMQNSKAGSSTTIGDSKTADEVSTPDARDNRIC